MHSVAALFRVLVADTVAEKLTWEFDRSDGDSLLAEIGPNIVILSRTADTAQPSINVDPVIGIYDADYQLVRRITLNDIADQFEPTQLAQLARTLYHGASAIAQRHFFETQATTYKANHPGHAA